VVVVLSRKQQCGLLLLETGHECGRLARDIVLDRLVVIRQRQLDHAQKLARFRLHGRPRRNQGSLAGESAHEGLRGPLVLPEVRVRRPQLKLGYLCLYAGYVKDAP
jgi:hypothetical protein